MGSLLGKNRSWNVLDADSSRCRTRMKDFKVMISQDQARDCPLVSIEHQLKHQAMPSWLGGALFGPYRMAVQGLKRAC
jgi:hypothetical protein